MHMYFLFNILYKVWPILWIIFLSLNLRGGNIVPLTVMGLFIWYSLKIGNTWFKIKEVSKSIRRKPSNEGIKKYVHFIEKTGIPNYPGMWGTLRETYRQISERDDIDYNLKLQLFEALRVKGTKGVYPPRKSSGISDEEKIRQAGEERERQVSYALKWLDRDKFKVFSNIRLSDGGEPQEFDTIVVGDKAVFNIETKNYIGDLTIDREGNWYRIVNGKKSGTENPVFQVKRHNKVLENVLESKIPIVDLIVWTNVESVIEGAQYSPVKVLKVDQLTYFIENYNEGEDLSREEISFAIEAIERNKNKKVKEFN